MSSDKFLNGTKIQEIEGSGKLKEILENLETHSFDGYVRIEIPEECEGFIIIKKGIPQNYYLKTPSDEIEGVEASEGMLSIDERSDSKMEVYKSLDVDELISKFEKNRFSSEEPEKEVISEGARTQLGPGLEKTPYEEIKNVFPDRYNFDNFVVGPNNRFAFAAATAVAKNPDKSYNPLFIKGESGLGKTHLLNAIGRHLSDRDPERNIKYIVTSKFITEYSKFSREDRLTEFKEVYIQFDTLLLDDIELLADKPEIQNILFYIFNEIQNKGGQILISSDRSPEKIHDVEERLVSRFKSGLVVDVLPPTYESRKEIVRMKAREFDIEIPPDVMDFIAKNVKKNIRLIEGALTRISAYSELMDEPITLESVRKSLTQYIEDEGDKKTLKLDLEEGRSYLIEEDRAEKCFTLFEKIEKDMDKFIVSRINPELLEEQYGFTDAEIKWLTDRESERFETVPPNLERLSWLLEKVIKGDSIILLDGLEYLISNINFDATLKFVRHMVDMVSETESIFLVIVSPKALDNRQVSILEREMDSISYIS